MASRQVFDPLKLLRVSPLILSTATLTYAGSELLFYGAFLNPASKSKSGAILPGWFSTTFNRIIFPLITVYTGTSALAFSNLFYKPEQLERPGQYTYWMYLVGALLSLGHFFFIPAVMRPVDRIVYDKSDGKSVEDLDQWLTLHKKRIFSVDILAWISYAAAFLTSFAVV